MVGELIPARGQWHVPRDPVLYPGEFTISLLGFQLVGLGCFEFCGEEADVFGAHSDAPPLLGPGVFHVRHALVFGAGAAPAHLLGIPTILCAGANALVDDYSTDPDQYNNNGDYVGPGADEDIVELLKTSG